MASQIYRFTWLGTDLAQINTSIGILPALLSPTSVPISIDITVDITADDTAFDDLVDTMKSLGWSYLSTDPALPAAPLPGPSTIWRPGAPSDGKYVETWEEAEALLAAADGFFTIVADDSLAALVIPATADTDFLGRGTLRSARTTRTPVHVLDGGRIRNIQNLVTIDLHGAPTIRPFVQISIPALVVRVQYDARLLLDVGATQPAIEFLDVASTLSMDNNGSLQNDVPAGVPLVNLPTPGTFLLFALFITTNGQVPVADRMFGGHATATLYTAHDAFTHLVQPQTLFPGAIITQRLSQQANILPAQGPTVNRPPAIDVLPGQTFFDTTLGIPVWWTGAAWVNSAGAPV